MKSKRGSVKKFNIIWSVVAVVIMFLIWAIAFLVVKNDYVVPSISQTFLSFFELFASNKFWVNIGYTLLRTLISFGISFLLAALFASISVSFYPFKRIAYVFVSFFRVLPTLAVTLMLLLWTNPFVAPIIVVCLVLFPLMYMQFITAYESVDKGLLQMAQVYSFSRYQILKNIYLPITLRAVFAQVGANVSFGLKIMVSAEIMSYTFRSLGTSIYYAKLYSDMAQFTALVIVVVILGVVLEYAFSFLNKISERWS